MMMIKPEDDDLRPIVGLLIRHKVFHRHLFYSQDDTCLRKIIRDRSTRCLVLLITIYSTVGTLDQHTESLVRYWPTERRESESMTFTSPSPSELHMKRRSQANTLLDQFPHMIWGQWRPPLPLVFRLLDDPNDHVPLMKMEWARISD